VNVPGKSRRGTARGLTRASWHSHRSPHGRTAAVSAAAFPPKLLVSFRLGLSLSNALRLRQPRSGAVPGCARCLSEALFALAPAVRLFYFKLLQQR